MSRVAEQGATECSRTEQTADRLTQMLLYRSSTSPAARPNDTSPRPEGICSEETLP
jgi:hypothetical protein